MKEIEIKSTQSNTTLTLFSLEGEFFYAKISNLAFSGTVRVSTYTDPMGISNLFKEMATEWAGWDKEKKWSSIEGGFSITCKHDKLGHITIEINMDKDDGSPEPWRLTTNLVLEAGQLDEISNSVKIFFEQNKETT